MTEIKVGQRVLIQEETEATVIAIAKVTTHNADVIYTFVKVRYDGFWRRSDWHPAYRVGIIISN